MVPWGLRGGSVTDPYGSVRYRHTPMGLFLACKDGSVVPWGKKEHHRILVTSEMQSKIRVMKPSFKKQL